MNSKVIIVLGLTVLGTSLFHGTSFAEKGEVMDFEADVIEGEKKAPELFLQLDSETTELGAVLYDRKTFNDFHSTDRNRRPRLSSPKIVK